MDSYFFKSMWHYKFLREYHFKQLSDTPPLLLEIERQRVEETRSLGLCDDIDRS